MSRNSEWNMNALGQLIPIAAVGVAGLLFMVMGQAAIIVIGAGMLVFVVKACSRR